MYYVLLLEYLCFSRNEPYSSSKYASDLVSVAINNQHNDKVGVSFCSVIFWSVCVCVCVCVCNM